MAAQKAAAVAARAARSQVGRTKPAKTEDLLAGPSLQERTTPTTPPPGAQAPVTLPAINAPNPLASRPTFPTPAGHIDLTPPRGGPTAENLAARPFSPDATNRGWMPTQQHYDAELLRKGEMPNVIGGAPIVNGRLDVPSPNELQIAMNNAADLSARHAQLKIAQHREMKWRNNPEGALAMQPEISRIEEHLGSADKTRQDFLAQIMPSMRTAYEQTARSAAPTVAQLKAQYGTPVTPAVQTTTPTPALEANTLADQLKKRQGFDYFSSQPLSYNLSQNQTSYL
jgi:hypothetical protein